MHSRSSAQIFSTGFPVSAHKTLGDRNILLCKQALFARRRGLRAGGLQLAQREGGGRRGRQPSGKNLHLGFMGACHLHVVTGRGDRERRTDGCLIFIIKKKHIHQCIVTFFSGTHALTRVRVHVCTRTGISWSVCVCTYLSPLSLASNTCVLFCDLVFPLHASRAFSHISICVLVQQIFIKSLLRARHRG